MKAIGAAILCLECDQIFDTGLVVDFDADLLKLLHLKILLRLVNQRSKFEANKFIVWELTFELFSSFFNQLVELRNLRQINLCLISIIRSPLLIINIII